MNPQDDAPESAERVRDGLSGVRFFFKVLPLVAVLVFLAYFVTERTRLFPDNRKISDPARAEYLVFAPERPATGENPGEGKPADPPPAGKSDTAAEAGKDGKTAAKKDDKKEEKKDAKKDSVKPADAGKPADSGKPADAGKPVEGKKDGAAADQPEITGPVEGGYVVVFLSRKLVALVKDQKYLRAYKDASIPENGKGGKADRADNRAPLGNYFIVDHVPQGNVLTLVLSYPNAKDAAAALQAKKITQAEYNEIVQSEKQKKSPPANTKLGGPVRIRGDGGADKKNHPGDICITADQMEELWLATRRGTPVCILE